MNADYHAEAVMFKDFIAVKYVKPQESLAWTSHVDLYMNPESYGATEGRICLLGACAKSTSMNMMDACFPSVENRVTRNIRCLQTHE